MLKFASQPKIAKTITKNPLFRF